MFLCCWLPSMHRFVAPQPRSSSGRARLAIPALAARVVVQSGRYSFRGPRLPLVLARLRPRGLLRALDFTGLCAQNFRAWGVVVAWRRAASGVARAARARDTVARACGESRIERERDREKWREANFPVRSYFSPYFPPFPRIFSPTRRPKCGLLGSREAMREASFF